MLLARCGTRMAMRTSRNLNARREDLVRFMRFSVEMLDIGGLCRLFVAIFFSCTLLRRSVGEGISL